MLPLMQAMEVPIFNVSAAKAFALKEELPRVSEFPEMQYSEDRKALLQQGKFIKIVSLCKTTQHSQKNQSTCHISTDQKH